MVTNDTISGVIERKFTAVSNGDTLETAVKIMTQANVTALVVKQDDEVTGIVTIKDIMYSIAKGDDLQGTKISSFMTACEFITKKGTKNPCVNSMKVKM